MKDDSKALSLFSTQRMDVIFKMSLSKYIYIYIDRNVFNQTNSYVS